MEYYLRGNMHNRVITKHYIALFAIALVIAIPLYGVLYPDIDLKKITQYLTTAKQPVMMNYENYKTEQIELPKEDEYYKPLTKSRYTLVQIVNSTQSLEDNKGKTWWTRELINRPEEYYSPNEITTGHVLASSDYNFDLSSYPQIMSLINKNGTLAIRTEDCQRWELIDSTGKEILLPPRSGSLNFEGFIKDTYYLFSQSCDPQWDDQDSGDYGEYERGPFQKRLTDYEPDPNREYYISSGNGYCLFREDGTLYRQYTLPDSLILGDMFINSNLNTILYTYINIKTRSAGIIYCTFEGRILSQLPDFPFYENDSYLVNMITEGNSYIILNDLNYHTYILDQSTGNYITRMHTMNLDFSSTATGYLALTYGEYNNGEWLIIYDIKNNKLVFGKQFQKSLSLRDVHISSDGKECSITDTDYKISLRRYFHLVQ